MAQKTIIMEREAGVYKIPCKVNGAKMKMIFDTGASSVAISLSIAEYLYENDYITKNDIIGTGKAQVADGRIVNNLIINLRDIEIDGVHVYNVQATVSESLTAPLLFGQSAIQKLGRISLHGNILTIEDAYDENASEERLNELSDNAHKYFEEDNYYMAVRNLLDIEKSFGLNDEGFYMLCHSYYFLGEYQNCYDAGIRFEQSNKKKEENLVSEKAGMAYQIVAGALTRLEYYSEAIKWDKKAIGTLSMYDGHEDTVDYLYFDMATNQANLKEYLLSLTSYEKAIELRCKFLHIAKDGIYKDKYLGAYYKWYAMTLNEYYKDRKRSDVIKYLRKSVQCGNEDAQETLKELGY
jgi:clan AA aspartic protease (TIGR02281 family)